MQQYRRGEQGKRIPPRADRFFKVENDWYYQVRGGRTFGPYRCREEAEEALHKHLNPPLNYHGNVRPFGSQRARRWRSEHKF